MAATAKYYLHPRETTQTTREEILKGCWKGLGLEVDESNLDCIASLCKGFEGDDLLLLCSKALSLGIDRMDDSIPTNLIGSSNYVVKVNPEDFVKAKERALGSITRGLDILFPKVTWDDIGGQDNAKDELKSYLSWGTNFDTSPTRGVLLYGPDGCGKTSLVKAVAHAADASLFRLMGPRLFGITTKGGEELIRRTFKAARLSTPSVIFVDNMDFICIKPEDCCYGGEYTAKDLSHTRRLLDVILGEMWNLYDAKGVLVLSTCEAYNAAIMMEEGGPFGGAVSVPLPDLQGRVEILNIKTKALELAADVNLEYIAQKTESFSGARLQWICKEAKLLASLVKATCISMDHFERVIDDIRRREIECRYHRTGRR